MSGHAFLTAIIRSQIYKNGVSSVEGTFSGDLAVGGDSTLTGTLDVTGATTITGATTCESTLNVEGVFTAEDNVVIGSTVADTCTINSLIGFYGTTPIAQPTTGSAAAAFVAGSGSAVLDDSTFGGYTLQQIGQALLDFGLLATPA